MRPVQVGGLAAAAVLLWIPRGAQAGDLAACLSAWDTANASYKQALQASSLHRTDDAKKHLATFRALWASFAAEFAASAPPPFAKDRRWRRDVEAVTDWIRSAGVELEAGEDTAAHETLENVRLRWLEVRSRHRMTTFGDHLVRYHEPMEAVTLTVKGKDADGLTDRDVAKLRRTLPALVRLWQAVERADRAEAAETRSGPKRSMVAAEGAAIQGLRNAVRSGDRADMVRFGAALKPAFAKLYMAFG